MTGAAHVYFIKPVGMAGPIKVGVSTDPARRRRQLQFFSPVELEVIGSVPGGRREESELHQRFASFNSHGEWFRADDALVSEVRAILCAGSIHLASPSENLIHRAIDLAGGSEAKLAEAVGLSQPLINKAKQSGRAGPRLAIAIHRFSKGAISGSALRPDLWLKPEDVPVVATDAAPSRASA